MDISPPGCALYSSQDVANRHERDGAGGEPNPGGNHRVSIAAVHEGVDDSREDGEQVEPEVDFVRAASRSLGK